MKNRPLSHNIKLTFSPSPQSKQINAGRTQSAIATLSDCSSRLSTPITLPLEAVLSLMDRVDWVGAPPVTVYKMGHSPRDAFPSI